MTKQNLAKEIVNYMNYVSNYMFFEDELEDGAKEYLAMIDQNDTQQIIDTLMNEYNDGNDSKALELLEALRNLTESKEIKQLKRDLKKASYVIYIGESNQYFTKNEKYFIVDWLISDEKDTIIILTMDDDNKRHKLSKNYIPVTNN